jgi:hypothetical protein
MPPRKLRPAHLQLQSFPGGSIGERASLLARADISTELTDDERSESSDAEVAPSTQASRAGSKGKSKQATVEDDDGGSLMAGANGNAESGDEEDDEIEEDEFVLRFLCRDPG